MIEKPRNYWTEERIITTLQELHAQGVPMHSTTLQYNHSALYGGITRRFRFLKRALRAAGLEPVVYRWVWTPERIIIGIRQAYADGVVMNATSLKVNHSSLQRACSQFFGSTERAIVAAGIKPSPIKRPLPPAPKKGETRKKPKPKPTPVRVYQEPDLPRSLRQNPFEVAADLSRKSNGVVLNRITSPLSMSEAQRMQQGGR